MDRRRFLIIMGVFLGVIVLLIACAALLGGRKPRPKPETITLTYWRTFDDKSVFEPLIAEYQKENPYVKIEYKKLDAKDYEQTLLDALASGKGPDMFSIGNDWVPKYKDKLAPISDGSLSVDAYEKAFFPVAKDDNVLDDKIYGIPYYIDTLALFYNQDIFTKAGLVPPQTWDELTGRPADPTRPGDTGLTSMLDKLTDRPQGAQIRQAGIALGTSNVPRAQDIVALMMRQRFTDMVNSDRDKALFNLPKKSEQGVDVHPGTEALNFYTSFALPSSPNYTWNATGSFRDPLRSFAEQRVALFIGYSYNIAAIDRLAPNLKYGVRPVPQFGNTNEVNYASYWTEVVSKESKHQQAAWKFIEFVASKDKIGTYTNVAKRPPSRRNVQTYDKISTFYRQNETATSWYKGFYSRADKTFIDMINRVIQGNEDPQRAVDTAAEEQTATLKALKNGNTDSGSS